MSTLLFEKITCIFNPFLSSTLPLKSCCAFAEFKRKSPSNPNINLNANLLQITNGYHDRLEI